jgi:predicted nucleic acid-binding protein
VTGINANVAVIDTNVFVSAVLYPGSSSAACVEWFSLHPFGDIRILSPRKFVEGRIQLETKK